MDKAYIYKITSPTKRVYIGSTLSIQKRWRSYKTLKCKDQPRLFHSFMKHGVDKHSFEVISECTKLDRFKQEAYYGNLYNCLGKNGLNCCLPKSETYISISDETREKIRISSTGRKKSDEALKKMSEWQIGRKLPQSTKDKLRLSKLGTKLSEEHKKNISIGGTGKIISEETRIKISNANKGKLCSDYTKLMVSIANTGRKVSLETREKLREARKFKVYTQETRNKMSKSLTGKKRTQETKDKISDVKKKVILNIETGIFYFGLKEAASSANLNFNTLAWKLCGNGKNNTKFIYV